MTAFNLHKFRASQEQIVALIAAMVFIAFAIRVPDFLSASNITALIQNVSVLGILATGMALSVLGRNIDLSMVASMAVSVAWMPASSSSTASSPVCFS